MAQVLLAANKGESDAKGDDTKKAETTEVRIPEPKPEEKVNPKELAITKHEEKQVKKYKEYKGELRRYNNMQKRLRKIGNINTEALVKKMENAATPTVYHETLKQWNKIQEVYNSSGCVPPPPPAILQVERPSIELQCHKGYKIGWDEARTWTELIWEDLKKPNSSDSDKLTLWKDKISHYTRCLKMWFSSKHQVFHICAKRGMLEGIDHFVQLYFVKGKKAVETWKKNRDKKDKSVTVWKAKYKRILKKSNPKWCKEHYPMNILSTEGRADLQGACGQQRGFPNGLYCAGRDFPVCDVNRKRCMPSQNEEISIKESSIAGPMKKRFKKWWRQCNCGNGQDYRAACDGQKC